MKKILISFLVLSLVFVACKKKSTTPAQAPTPAPAPASIPLTDTMTMRFGVILYRGSNHNNSNTNKPISDSVTRIIIKNSKYSYTTSFIVPKPDTTTYSTACAQPIVSCPFVLTKNATCTITIVNGEFDYNTMFVETPTFTFNTSTGFPMSSSSSGLQLVHGQGKICTTGNPLYPINTALVFGW